MSQSVADRPAARLSAADAAVDLIVIGAGINGAGVARDAAMRGLSVTLVEASDIASGTSGWSSRLIHGGLRYLEHYDLSLVRESLREREVLLATAPHLVAPLPLVIPLAPSSRRAPWKIRAGMWAYDLLSWQKSLPGHRMLPGDELAQAFPGARLHGFRAAVRYFDAQVTWAERLVLENVLDADAFGATVCNRTPVRAPWLDESGVAGVELADGRRLRSRAVVNAAGPWVDTVLAGRCPALIGGTRGAHLVLDPPAPLPPGALYVESGADGRPVFLIPWAGQLLVGTTDERHWGDPRRVAVTAEERDYLLREAAAIWPDLGSPARIRHVYSGVRPLPRSAKGDSPGKITRRHIIHRHAGRLRGLFSIVGGKLTTYRQLAQETVDTVQRHLGDEPGECFTATRTLLAAGGDWRRDSQAWMASCGLPEAQARRLLGIYGVRAQAILERMQAEPATAEPLCPVQGGYMAELVHALEHEWCQGLEDFLLRRSMLGLGEDFGLAAARRVLAWAHAHLGWQAAECERQWQAYRELAALRQVRALADYGVDWRDARREASAASGRLLSEPALRR